LAGPPTLQKVYAESCLFCFLPTWWKTWGLLAFVVVVGVALIWLLFGTWRVLHSEESRRDLGASRALALPKRSPRHVLTPDLRDAERPPDWWEAQADEDWRVRQWNAFDSDYRNRLLAQRAGAAFTIRPPQASDATIPWSQYHALKALATRLARELEQSGSTFRLRRGCVSTTQILSVSGRSGRGKPYCVVRANVASRLHLNRCQAVTLYVGNQDVCVRHTQWCQRSDAISR